MARNYSIEVQGNEHRLNQSVPFRVDSLGRVTPLCGVNFTRRVEQGDYVVDLGSDLGFLGSRRDGLDHMGLRIVQLKVDSNTGKVRMKSHYPDIRLKYLTKKGLEDIKDSRHLTAMARVESYRRKRERVC